MSAEGLSITNQRGTLGQVDEAWDENVLGRDMDRNEHRNRLKLPPREPWTTRYNTGISWQTSHISFQRRDIFSTGKWNDVIETVLPIGRVFVAAANRILVILILMVIGRVRVREKMACPVDTSARREGKCCCGCTGDRNFFEVHSNSDARLWFERHPIRALYPTAGMDCWNENDMGWSVLRTSSHFVLIPKEWSPPQLYAAIPRMTFMLLIITNHSYCMSREGIRSMPRVIISTVQFLVMMWTNMNSLKVDTALSSSYPDMISNCSDAPALW
ncbi:hypothetical protein BDZ97DRAFT_1758718 [Flammula alnicola]|nr:hypothetical protein BDZ97DRAFT_1758718 [Flammula alnicola]